MVQVKNKLFAPFSPFFPPFSRAYDINPLSLVDIQNPTAGSFPLQTGGLSPSL
jgi:hypothetical protein